MDILNLAIIPARANSKGVPGKNLKELCGVPLIDWTLHAAFNAGHADREDKSDDSVKFHPLFDMIALTSESDDILDEGIRVSKMYPDIRFVPYKRDEKLSQDHVQTDEVCLDVLRYLEQIGDSVDNICLLQPTSPFRTSEHISDSFSLWGNSATGSFGCAISGARISELQGYNWYCNNNHNIINPVGHDPDKRYGRQWEIRLPHTIYQENGAVYWFKAKRFSLTRSYRQPPFVFYEMNERDSVDINTEDDWLEAERRVIEDGWKIIKVNV